ncbi:MAG: FCD domain-containing protein [Thermomicrobiales bacterium]
MRLEELNDALRRSHIPSDAVFHAAMLTCVPNALLTQMLTPINGCGTHVRNFAHTQPGAHMCAACNKHVHILSAVHQRDPEAHQRPHDRSFPSGADRGRCRASHPLAWAAASAIGSGNYADANAAGRASAPPLPCDGRGGETMAAPAPMAQPDRPRSAG